MRGFLTRIVIAALCMTAGGVLWCGEPAAADCLLRMPVTCPPEMNDLYLQPAIVPQFPLRQRCGYNTYQLHPYAVVDEATEARFVAQIRELRKAQKPVPGQEVGFDPVTALPVNIRSAKTKAGVVSGGKEAFRDFDAQVPAGTYDLYVPYRNIGAIWCTGVKVTQGVLVQEIKVAQPGSVRVTWSIDYPLHKEPQPANPADAGLEALLEVLKGVPEIGLLRDGRVWAQGRMIHPTEFLMPEIQPGEYTLVVRNTYERFLYTQEKVTVKSGEETVIKAAIQRGEQAGLGLAFYDSKNNTYPHVGAAAMVIDTKLQMLFEPSKYGHGEITDNGAKSGFMIQIYGGLSPNGKYLLVMQGSNAFREIVNQALTPVRPANCTVVALTKTGAVLPPEEDYKYTMVRLQRTTAIKSKAVLEPELEWRGITVRPIPKTAP